MKKADDERRARAQAATRRKVPIVMDFQPLLELEVAKALSNGGMLDVVNRLAVLDTRVDDAKIVIEEGRKVPG